VSDNHLSDVTKGKVRQMMREICELESIGDSCYNMARILKRRQETQTDLTPELYEKLNGMIKLTDNALTQMNVVMRGHAREHDIRYTYNIENNINLDIIVSNPPYILNQEDAQASVRDYEPASALWLDKEHSVYESIFRDYKKVKKGSLFMAFEISPDLEMWLEDLMKKYLEDYSYEFAKDLNGFTRFLYIFLK
jgi:hypothetical protein